MVACYLVIISWWPPHAQAQEAHPEVRIIVLEKSPAHLKVVEQLRGRFPSSRVFAEVAAAPRRGNTRYIAVGQGALQLLLSKDIEDPIFSLLVPSLAYREAIAGAGRGRQGNVTAIFAEASPAAQLQLIARLFKSETHVAVLHTHQTTYLQPALRHAAANANMRISFVQVGDQGLNRALNRISDAAVLLALPDEAIYNAQSIQTVLLTTYQRGQAVLGFSTSLVRAGALATTYSTVDDMVSQLEEIVLDYNATGRMPAPQHPKYFSTFSNDSVSRSLDIVVDEAARNFGRRPSDR